MCGFIRRTTDSSEVQALLSKLNIDLGPLTAGDFRPQAILRDVIIEEDGHYKKIDAIWWYALKKQNQQWLPNRELTTFNARNLRGRLYSEPLKMRRAIVVANAIGESNPQEGKKTPKRYLMEGPKGVILGALYQKWETEFGPIYSVAVITRDPHPRFSAFHNKSTPLFLPADPSLMRLWLAKSIQDHSDIDNVLAVPRLVYPFQVSEVKTYKHGELIGESCFLDVDG